MNPPLDEQANPSLTAGLFFILDGQGNILDFNRDAANFFGLDEACFGQSLLTALVAEAEAPKLIREFGYVLSLCTGGDARSQNIRLPALRNGVPTPATLRIMRERREDGNSQFIALFQPDVSATATNVLRPLQNLLETVVSNTRDGVLIHDSAGNILYANDAAASCLGFATLADLMVLPVSQVWQQWRISGDSGPVDLGELPAWLADQGGLSLESTLHFQHCQGTRERWLTVSASIALGGDGFSLGTAVFLLHDITARRRSDVDLLAALQKQERAAAEIAGVLGQIADGVIITDAAGKLTFVNAAARRLYGREPEENFDWDLHAGEMFHPDGTPVPAAEFPLGLALLKGETVQDAEWMVRRADGVEVWLQGSAAPLRDAAGSTIGSVFSVRDITARRGMLDDLERGNRIKDDFLTILSHELRTPLTPLVGYVTLLKSQIKGGRQLEPGLLSKALDALESNISQQRKIVEELLDASHLLLGRARFQLSPYPLTALIDESVAALHGEFGLKGLQVEVNLDPKVPAILMDVSRMGQAVTHVLHNAITFSATGGRVHIDAKKHDNLAVFTVRDEGAGIDPTFLPHVFDLFRQGDSSFTRRHGGLGLGLAVVKAIIEAHNGTIVAHSAGAGTGATIEIRLPLIKCV